MRMGCRYPRHHLAGGVDWNFYSVPPISLQTVTTLRVVWIEIFIASADEITSMSPPCGWCGLKFTWKSWLPATKASPPCGWCGLKYQEHGGVPKYLCHHLAGGVDWNYKIFSQPFLRHAVTTLRVVWIEITRLFYHDLRHLCHHLAGGVDWN